MSGWIKLHRDLIDWEWYTDHNTCRLFIHCILRANFEDKVWRGIPIKRGSFYTSLESLSSETGLTIRQIRTALDKLSLTGEVTSSGMARGRMITVSEYDSFQQDDRLNVSEKAGKGQALDRVATTNKNLNNLKNEKKYIHFDEFWAIFPRKEGKAKSMKIWKSLNVDRELFNKIESHFKAAYQGTEKQFVPHASTYLNGQRWLDEIYTNSTTTNIDTEVYL